MTGRELQIKLLRRDLVDYLEEMTAETFDSSRLDEILDRLEELDPIPPGILEDDETALRKFHEKMKRKFQTQKWGDC